MPLENTTPVPNEFFNHIPTLTLAEIRVLLVVLRQTVGWIDMKTGKRKIKDRMNYAYIIKRTGLYRTILSTTIQQLIEKNLLMVSDEHGNILNEPSKRRGHPLLFYQSRLVRDLSMTSSGLRTTLVRNSEHNKRNTKQKKYLQKKVNSENLERLKEMQATLAEHVRIKHE